MVSWASLLISCTGGVTTISGVGVLPHAVRDTSSPRQSSSESDRLIRKPLRPAPAFPSLPATRSGTSPQVSSEVHISRPFFMFLLPLSALNDRDHVQNQVKKNGKTCKVLLACIVLEILID